MHDPVSDALLFVYIYVCHYIYLCVFSLPQSCQQTSLAPKCKILIIYTISLDYWWNTETTPKETHLTERTYTDWHAHQINIAHTYTAMYTDP